MRKNEIRVYVVLSIILVVFFAVAFAIPFTKTVVFWLAIIFAMIAILSQICFYKISFSGSGDVKSKFYGFPIIRVGWIYLLVQLVISIIEMSIASFLPAWVAFVVNVTPLAFAAIGCIAVDAMRDEIVRQDVKLKNNVSVMRSIQSLSSSIVGLASDDIKSDIQSLADEFKYSDPVSSDHTMEIERELNQQLKELQKSVVDGDVDSAKKQCKNISASLSERNRICALNK